MGSPHKFEYKSHYIAGDFKKQDEEKQEIVKTMETEYFRHIWSDVTMSGQFMVFRRMIK